MNHGFFSKRENWISTFHPDNPVAGRMSRRYTSIPGMVA